MLCLVCALLGVGCQAERTVTRKDTKSQSRLYNNTIGVDLNDHSKRSSFDREVAGEIKHLTNRGFGNAEAYSKKKFNGGNKSIDRPLFAGADRTSRHQNQSAKNRSQSSYSGQRANVSGSSVKLPTGFRSADRQASETGRKTSGSWFRRSKDQSRTYATEPNSTVRDWSASSERARVISSTDDAFSEDGVRRLLGK